MPQSAGEWSGFVLAIWLLANMLIVGVWDMYALLVLQQPEYSVSSFLHVWLSRFPILAVGTGILIGHLVWPPDQSRFK